MKTKITNPLAKVPILAKDYNDLNRIVIGQMQVLLDNLEEMSETNVPRHNLKNALNRFKTELNNEINKSYKMYTEVGKVEISGEKHSAEDLFWHHMESYQELFNRPFHHVIVINDLIKKSESNGVDLDKVAVEYQEKL